MTQMKNLKKLLMGFLILGAGVAQATSGMHLMSDAELTPTEKKKAERAVEIAKANLREGRVERVAREGLEVLVGAALNLLRAQGHEAYADRKASEWNTSFSLFSRNGLGDLDLGDHAPLSQWLAGFYDGVASRVDEQWLKLFNIYDLKIFNFGIPVALRPSGNPATGGDWGEEEYRLHFVPVASASIFWVSYGACSLTVPPPFSLGCGVASRLPRYGMKFFVAPRLSDEIYKRFNR